MNFWTKQSVDLANQKNYLDLLYKVYPMSANARREIPYGDWRKVKFNFENKNKIGLIKALCDLDIFPIKDSYVAYLKRDRTAIERNPNTVERLSGILYELGLDGIYDNCTEPKETNRQIGPMFKNWIDRGCLGATVYKNPVDFVNSKGNAILNIGDTEMKNFAKEYFGFNRDKGLDFIGRFNDTYILGEAKFLTDFGGHQNAQFDDAISTVHSDLSGGIINGKKVIKIAIMDGVLFIKGKNKMHKYLEDNPDDIIVSALVLRDFLYSL